MHIMIYTSYRPLLIRILPTQYFIALTNQVCQIGLIWISICPNPVLWTRLRWSSLLFIESMRIQLSRVILSTAWLTFSFINPISRSTYRREIFFIKEFRSHDSTRQLQISTDSILTKNSQVQNPYSIFQVPPQKEEHTDLEKSMKSMIQFQSDPFDMIEARLSRLENMYRNEKTLPTQSLTISDTPSHIDENQESWYLKDYYLSLIHIWRCRRRG